MLNVPLHYVHYGSVKEIIVLWYTLMTLLLRLDTFFKKNLRPPK